MGMSTLEEQLKEFKQVALLPAARAFPPQTLPLLLADMILNLTLETHRQEVRIKALEEQMTSFYRS